MYEKKNYKRFLNLIYTIFYCEQIQAKPLTLCQRNLAMYLGITRRSVYNYLKQFEDSGFCKRANKVKKANGRKNTQWYVWEFEVDFKALEMEMIVNGFKILPFDEMRDQFDDFCTFSKALKKASKKYNNDVEAVPEEEINRIVVNEETRKARSFARLCEKHETALNRLKELNDYYQDRGFGWSYLGEQKKRMTNVLCTTRNPEKSGDYARIDLIAEILGCEKAQVEEFDIKSSIYNVSYALGTGEIAGIETDFYEVIFKRTNLKYERSEWKKLRKFIKLLFMPVYMKESSLKFHALTFDARCKSEHLNRADEMMVEAEKFLVDYFDTDLYTILDEIRNAMHKVFGLEKFYQKDVFLFESDLHINILWHLLKDYGIEALNVYDGFYTKKRRGFKAILASVYKQSFEELLNDEKLEKDIKKRRIEKALVA